MQSFNFCANKDLWTTLEKKKRNSKSIVGLNVQKGQKWLKDSPLKLNSPALFSSEIKLHLIWRDLEILTGSKLKQNISKMC